MAPTTLSVIEGFFTDYPLLQYNKGQRFVYPGDTIDYAYYLVKGRIKIYLTTNRGDEVIVHSFKDPEFFPLSLIMNDSRALFYYEADTNMVVRRAPLRDMKQLLDSHPEVIRNLFSLLHEKVDDIFERMAHLMSSSARDRLIYELIFECRRFGERQPDGSYCVTTSEKDLGARTGLSRETVNREAKILKNKGLLKIHRASMVITDITKLEACLEDRINTYANQNEASDLSIVDM